MTLADRAADRDAATFVARSVELAALSDFLAPGSEHRVAVVTGSAGMGKSALLRETARRAEARGYDVVWWDARERRTGRTTADVVRAATAVVRPLLVVDSAEELGPDEARLRDGGIGALPDGARVVLASRRPLEPAWWASAWAASILAVPVGPLTSPEASSFLVARGVPPGPESAAVLTWAEGHPLSLTLAGAVRRAGGRIAGPADLALLETDLLDLLTGGRLEGAELAGADRLVLAVAALAPAVDAALLDAVLGDGTGSGLGTAAERWLRTLPFAERLGHRVTLHQRVRRLLATRLRDAEPDVERALRVRIIDHLTDGVVVSSSAPQLLLDVREVLAPPQDRGVTPSRALASPWRVAAAGPGDDARVRRLLRGQDPTYAAWVERWVREAPDHVVVVRHPHDATRLAAVSVWASDETVPAAFRDDAVLRPWLAAAAAWRGGTLLNPVTEIDVDEADLAEVSALVLMSVVRASGLADFRRWVVPRKPPAPDPTHCGGVADTALDLVVGTTRLPAHVIDYGPGGAIQAMREEASEGASVDAVAPGQLVTVTVTADDVRDALRAFHDPVVLSASPLATGDDPVARTDSVRARITDAIAHAFGDTADARLQRDVLRLGYLDPAAGHTRAMHALHLSRTTYFRRLREATATLAAWLASSS